MSTKEILVKKRNGELEPLNIEKINKVISWAIEGLEDVSISDIEMNAKINFIDGITTKDIHNIIIESAVNLIDIDHSDYQYVASRLLNYSLRKDVWGGKRPPKLSDLIKKNIKNGKYSPALLETYTESEINKFDEIIDHDRDFKYTYAGIKQMTDKYLLKDLSKDVFFETPQFAHMAAGMFVFQKYSKLKRVEYVKRYYKMASDFKVNWSTPLLSKLRTPDSALASCCLLELNDTKESIDAVNYAVSAATYNGYGIGVNMGRMRGIGSPINKGKMFHPGVIPFLRIIESEVKAWTQISRGGSATCTFPLWHYEIEDILQLKNAVSGTAQNRIFNLDYTIGISQLFYSRFVKNENITLFSPSEVPDLYDAYGTDKFEELYKKYESDDSIIGRKVISAKQLFELLIKERFESGRIYILNVDNANKHGSWCNSIYMSNLCLEILQDIVPLKSLWDETSEIGTCLLSAINWLEVKTEHEMERACDLVIRVLDEVADLQSYFHPAAERFTKQKRSLGVGITNLAGFLAYHKLKYSDKEALELVHNKIEQQQYYLLKSSNQLAIEKGKCEKFDTSKYSIGKLPIDWYNKNVDTLISNNLKMDWETIRNSIKEHGLRNTTVSAIMPCESSSVCNNSTNGVEPVRALSVFKGSKKGLISFLVPNVKTHGEHYTLAFEQPDNIGYLNICAIIQKFTDMGMSINVYYNPANYSDKKVPYQIMLKEMLYHSKMGGKTMYYSNTQDGNKQFESKNNCSSGACSL